MHELSMAQAVTEMLCQQARKAGAKRVTRFELHVGRYRGIVPELLSECLKYTLADTLGDGAQIDIIEIPIRVRCPKCEEIRQLENFFLICPVCEALCPEVVSGKELLLHSMQIED